MNIADTVDNTQEHSSILESREGTNAELAKAASEKIYKRNMRRFAIIFGTFGVMLVLLSLCIAILGLEPKAQDPYKTLFEESGQKT